MFDHVRLGVENKFFSNKIIQSPTTLFFEVRLWLIGQSQNTIAIPPCAVKKMRVTFPAEDGNYTGYKDDDTGDDDDKALMAR